MTEETETLDLEMLRAIRTDMVRMKHDVAGTRVELTAIRHDPSRLRTLQEPRHSDIASPKLRVERLERRLDLID